MRAKSSIVLSVAARPREVRPAHGHPCPGRTQESPSHPSLVRRCWIPRICLSPNMPRRPLHPSRASHLCGPPPRGSSLKVICTCCRRDWGAVGQRTLDGSQVGLIDLMVDQAGPGTGRAWMAGPGPIPCRAGGGLAFKPRMQAMLSGHVIKLVEKIGNVPSGCRDDGCFRKISATRRGLWW